MPNARLFPDADLSYLNLHGDITGAALLSSAHRLHQAEGWNMGMDVICDASRLLSLDVGMASLRRLVALRAEDPEGRDAVVVHRDLDASLAHAYRVLCKRNGSTVHVCHTLVGAVRALERDEAWVPRLRTLRRSFTPPTDPATSHGQNGALEA